MIKAYQIVCQTIFGNGIGEQYTPKLQKKPPHRAM